MITNADIGLPRRHTLCVEEGRVAWIAPDVVVGAADEVIDARGGGVIPGLHDHHVHLYATAAARSSLRLGPPEVVDRGGFEATLREGDRRLPPGAWIRAMGYHETVAGSLDRWVLDAIVPNRPVRVQHRNGSLWVLNSEGLERLPENALRGSGVARDAANVPTGRLT